MTDPKTDVWMPLWIGSYLADTMKLTTVQHGAYFLLLMAYWRERSPLKDDDDELRSITKTERAEWRRMRPVLAAFFKVGEGVWWHKRVEQEMAEADKRSLAAKVKAQKGADARWKDKDKSPPSDAPSMPRGLPEDKPKECPPPSPLPLPSEDSVPNGTDGDAVLTKAELWNSGKSLLSGQGMAAAQCGSFIGKLVKDYGDEVVIDAVRSCVVKRPADAAQYLIATCQHLKGQRQKPDVSRQTVPSKQERDPELIRRDLESKTAAKPPAAVLELADRLRVPTQGARA